MKIAIINESFPTYNLCTHRMENLFRAQGHEVFSSPRADMWSAGCERAFLSVIFTWHLPNAVQDVKNLLGQGIEVEIGGPAATAMPQYIEAETGLIPHIGLDQRFEHVPGREYQITFTSRGCIRKCPWCIVHKVEPNQIEYDDFPIPTGRNPFVGDNCILGTSEKHQKRVVERLKNLRNLDMNSGFDCRLFTEDHYQLYKNLHLEAWRVAFDSMGVESEFRRAVTILKKHKIDYRRIIVYVLIGFPGTTLDESVYRLETARALGCSPYPQKFAPLNSIDARNYIAPGFEKEKLDMLRTYWVNPFAWRTCSWEDFKKNYRNDMDEKSEQLWMEAV